MMRISGTKMQSHHIYRLLITLLLLSPLALDLRADSLKDKSEDSAGEEANLKIFSNDLIRISVFEEPELGTEQRVDGNGRIRIPLLGNVGVAGLTIRDAEEKIEATFVEQRFLKTPQVTIYLVEHAQRQISILGQIRQPGPITFPEGMQTMNILDVISRAGGFSGIAKSNSVRVTRIGSGEKEEVFSVNVDDLISGSSQDGSKRSFLIYPGDVIFVPERLF